MPYSGKNDPNLPENVKKMPADDREQWVEVFNSAYKSCISDGGSAKSCETSAFKQANGVMKKAAISFRSLLSLVKRIFGAKVEQALGIPDLYGQVATAAYEDEASNYAWLIDVYVGDSGMFAVFSSVGKLFKVPVTVDTESNTATIPSFGDWEEVKEEFVPVNQVKSSFKIRAQKDGTNRWFLIAGTTILNRNAQIDSSNLFDNMIKKCENGSEYPYLTFFHLGRAFQMGTCDYLARDGVALIASGVFDDSNLAKAMIRSYESEPDYWGSSIGFLAEEPEMIEIVQDVKLPVYNDGELVEISILPEKQACAIMTALRSTKEVNRMEKRVEEAIKKLADGDETLAEEFISKVDDVNRSVTEQNLIHRSTEEETVTEEPVVEEEEIVIGEPVTQEIEISDEVIQTIADKVLAAVSEKLGGIQQAVEDLGKDVLSLHAIQIKQSKDVEAELTLLKRSDEDKLAELEKDQSAKIVNKIRVTHRPTQRSQEDEEKPNFAEIASATLSNLK